MFRLPSRACKFCNLVCDDPIKIYKTDGRPDPCTRTTPETITFCDDHCRDKWCKTHDQRVFLNDKLTAKDAEPLHHVINECTTCHLAPNVPEVYEITGGAKWYRVFCNKACARDFQVTYQQTCTLNVCETRAFERELAFEAAKETFSKRMKELEEKTQ